ncbi:cAMP-binding domain of CRP or a regulatory subunit of cAMP-dependent protein kinases [Chryseobacterium oleae]|uniref:cAMP-binding domain of CRP or a regulatory subunit of cAMP-dependent protein kinases n=1 Tax=Chryseobacterium oleae TaxID=491207 RepID=A0A1I4YUU2_CHROL|nr:Crp/Fnr family transcriptional regulator [Chryseobacterium oleae]SFN41400.1 cAMP-binding domain of CRP or a regulatory subunit of cAMP-dependent protein kinases [Chryseobacterium oleae]
MIINEEILNAAGAGLRRYIPDESIFYEGTVPAYYYQIIDGEVKTNSYNADGKEFIQNVFFQGQSFGESLLFGEKLYPMNAVAVSRCSILRLAKADFFNILEKNPDLYLDFCKSLSDALYYKYIMHQKNSLESPEERIIGVMDYLKSFEKKQCLFSYLVPLTRQQLASLTGIRVETAIKTIKRMEKENIVKIINRKILY